MFPKLSRPFQIDRLTPPTGRSRIVIDTDTYNEIDDQFAVVYALLSPEKIEVEALYAAPFFNHRADSPGHGMEQSYDEIGQLLDRLGLSTENFAYRGSNDFLQSRNKPIHSEAVDDLIARAMAAPDDDPLTVVAIGALTNIASAILIEPKIIEKIVVVWLGGNALHWPHTVEFNLAGDVTAARVVYDCGVPLVMLPCAGVTTHLRTTVPEIEKYVLGKGAIGDFLAQRFMEYSDNHFGWSKEIWDVIAVAYLINPDWAPSYIVPSPIIAQRDSSDVGLAGDPNWGNGHLVWATDPSRHPIRYMHHLERDPIMRDMFTKLDRFAKGDIKLE